ncbi:unnamed protein product [Ectocarpus sp. 8 AP-2014]
MTSADVFGDLTVQVLRGINLQNVKAFGTCNPYVLVKMTSSPETKTTGVRESDANPSWHETFIFRNVASTDALQISLMEKEGSKEGVVSVRGGVRATEWGFPGVGGGERVLEVTMPCTTDTTGVPNMGTVVLKLQYRAQLKFRAPFGVIKTAAAKTAILTDKAKIDVVVDKVMNVLFKPVAMAEGVAKRLTKAQKIMYGGSAAAVSSAVGGGASMTLLALAVPVFFMALLFLPLTLMGGFFLAVAMLVIMPCVLALGWVILCSRPVQCRVWMPWLFWAMCKSPLVHKALLQPPPHSPSGTQQ